MIWLFFVWVGGLFVLIVAVNLVVNSVVHGLLV